MKRSKSFGPSLGGNLGPRGLGRIDKPDKPAKAGLYPKKEDGVGRYGTTAYPSIIESYDRASDYRRWKLGQELFYGLGSNWASLLELAITRELDVPGGGDLSPGGSRALISQFPSLGSPEGAWYTSVRPRGSIIFPVSLDAAHITLDTSNDDFSQHTLVYDCSSFYTEAQAETLRNFIGSQFEDTASGPSYPDDLIAKPVGSVALTLVGVDTVNRVLTFDLSRPHLRVKPNKQIYWYRERYRPDLAIPIRQFSTSQGRHLCSSHRFFCTCPDFLGTSVANVERPKGGLVDRFPVPNLGRTDISAWESEGAGYFRQWRSLPARCDQRRECKHVHCLRWECAVPWLEPEDYPTVESRQSLVADLERASAVDSNQTRAYFGSSRVNWNRLVLPIADGAGLNLFPGADPRDGARPDLKPILWNDSRRPETSWCQHNDWWAERGKSEVLIFNSNTQEFEPLVIKGGNPYPVVEFVEAGSTGAPVIVL